MSDTLSAEQYEIVQLLHQELSELLALGGSSGEVERASNELVETYSIQLSNLSNAAELAGLHGFSAACIHLNNNLSLLASNDHDITTAISEALFLWPSIFLAYIDAIGSANEASTCKAIVDFLERNLWPEALSEAARTHMLKSFSQSQLLDMDDSEALPVEVTLAMVSLDIPDDVRQELVDGMMMELPTQVEVFEASIGDYLASHSFDDLNQAQRMAHTLKGAANIVGVAGVANLMHYIEDLLEQGAKLWDEAPEGFDDLLLNASDCLASMAEYLCGLGPEPEERVSVMQEVLHWLVPIKNGGTLPSVADESSAEIAVVLDATMLEAAKPTDCSSPAVQCAEDSIALEDLNALNTPMESELTCDEVSDSYQPLVDVQCDKSVFDESFVCEDFDDQLSELALVDEVNSDAVSESSGVVDPSDELEAKAVELEGSPNVESQSEGNAVTQQSKSLPQGTPPVVTEQEDIEEKHFIHLPESTAQELLRISGESQIANTQLNAQIESMQTSIELTERYHRKIRQMAAELEVIVQTQSALSAAASRTGDDQLDPLELERYSELHSFSNQLLELTADSFEAVTQIEGQIEEMNNLVYLQRQQNRDNQNVLLHMRLIPVSSLSSRFNRCVRQASRLTHKPARLEISGEATLLDSRVLNRIADPIMHLLRNAVDHGLERNAGLREQVGKAGEGCIQLRFEHTGETITIECKDDGAGLDYNAIKQAAFSKGLVAEGDATDDAMLNQLIMMPGFSTRKGASQTSGRGIGLDAVVSEIRALKGNMSVQSTPGEGCCFTLVVPTSIISGHAVLVSSHGSTGKQSLAVVTRNVEQILFVQREDLLTEGGLLYYDFQDEKIAVLELNHLTNAKGLKQGKISCLLLTRRPDGSRVGIAVESILASQDMVIKPLNEFTYHPEGVVGATILGDGSIAPVVDLQELPGMGLSQTEYQRVREQREKIASLDESSDYEAPIALIVDDSLSARRSLAQFMSDIGMDVRTAKDGFEAISVLGDKKPALMLVDLEMPRMNGLELTAHLRSRDDTKDIPVIMITSRATEKHRLMAQKAGVNSYLNKPWSDEDLMATIQQQIA